MNRKMLDLIMFQEKKLKSRFVFLILQAEEATN
jgi:hypothetical protein